MGENLIEAYTTPDYRDSVRAVIKRAMQGVETSNFGKLECMVGPDDV